MITVLENVPPQSCWHISQYSVVGLGRSPQEYVGGIKPSVCHWLVVATIKMGYIEERQVVLFVVQDADFH